MQCIFGSANQWATLEAIAPVNFSTVADYEIDFGITIHRKLSVLEQAARGEVYPSAMQWAHLAMSHTFTAPVFMKEWIQPAGA